MRLFLCFKPIDCLESACSDPIFNLGAFLCEASFGFESVSAETPPVSLGGESRVGLGAAASEVGPASAAGVVAGATIAAWGSNVLGGS